MEWSDVIEHPPPFAHRVLLCDEYDYISTGINMNGKYHYSDGEEPGGRVTHWMELPDGPRR